MEFDEFFQDEEPLPDRGFTRAVMARVERHRVRRRLAIAIAIVIAAAITIIARPSFIAPAAELVVGALILMTLCSFAWIETENGSN
jgi:hypothetical protein